MWWRTTQGKLINLSWVREVNTCNGGSHFSIEFTYGSSSEADAQVQMTPDYTLDPYTTAEDRDVAFAHLQQRIGTAPSS